MRPGVSGAAEWEQFGARLCLSSLLPLPQFDPKVTPEDNTTISQCTLLLNPLASDTIVPSLTARQYPTEFESVHPGPSPLTKNSWVYFEPRTEEAPCDTGETWQHREISYLRHTNLLASCLCTPELIEEGLKSPSRSHSRLLAAVGPSWRLSSG